MLWLSLPNRPEALRGDRKGLQRQVPVREQRAA
jgi:hypothetical protein